MSTYTHWSGGKYGVWYPDIYFAWGTLAGERDIYGLLVTRNRFIFARIKHWRVKFMSYLLKSSKRKWQVW